MNENKTNINWYPGHMAKTKRLINEMSNLIDIVFELVDARIPYSSKINDKDNLLLNKPHVLILTKYDLCDKEVTDKWIEEYKKKYKVVKLDLSNNNVNFNELINITNEIMKDINLKRNNKGMKDKEIHALVIGIPNVGKSTFINRFVGKTVATTGNKPGVTKNLVWLKTKSNILLLDTPGILWPKIDDEIVGLNLASFSAIKEEILPVDEVAWHILNMYNKYYPNILKERYKVDKLTEDFITDYDVIGHNMSALIKGGEIDYKKVSLNIINDIKKEIIKNITFDRKD